MLQEIDNQNLFVINWIDLFKVGAFLFFGIYLQYSHCLFLAAKGDLASWITYFQSHMPDDQFVMLFFGTLPLLIGVVYSLGTVDWMTLAGSLMELEIMKKFSDFQFMYLMATLNRAKLLRGHDSVANSRQTVDALKCNEDQ